MSKDLEKEYKALVSGEVPDLWARIEAGLDDKQVYNGQNENRAKKIVNFKVWTTVAAACLCAALIIPIMTIQMRGGEKNTASPQDNNALDGAAYAPKSADSSMEAAVENGLDAMADSGGGEGSMKNEVTAGISADEATNAQCGGVDMAAENVDEEAEAFDMFEAEVEILGVDLHTGFVVYTAKILKSGNSELEDGSEIEIIAYFSTNFQQLEKDAAYTLQLQPGSLDEEDGGERKSYVIAVYE